MSNSRYPLGLKALLDGDIDLLVSTVSMQMYSGAAVYDAAHDFLNDVAGTKQGAAVAVTAKTTTGGLFDGTVGSFNPPAAVTVIALVLYVDTGVDSTSRLVAWIDTKADGTALSIASDGSVFNLNWNGPIFSIGGI